MDKQNVKEGDICNEIVSMTQDLCIRENYDSLTHIRRNFIVIWDYDVSLSYLLVIYLLLESREESPFQGREFSPGFGPGPMGR